MIDVRREYDMSELNEYQIIQNIMEWIVLRDSLKIRPISFDVYYI